MKKIIYVTILSILTMLPAYSVGINVGISGSLAAFHATGEDNENGEISKEDAAGAAGYGSIFVEKTLGDRLAIGIDYVPTALESETSETVVEDLKGEDDGASSNQTNKVQVDFEDLTTLYLALNINENLYVKAGLVKVDVITNESLDTGSTYANTDMDGEVFGIGYNTQFGNGIFARIEGNYMDFGSASVTGSNTENKISLNNLEGVSGKISIGKSF